MIDNFSEMKHLKKGDFLSHNNDLYIFERFECSKNGHGIYLVATFIGGSVDADKEILFRDASGIKIL